METNKQTFTFDFNVVELNTILKGLSELPAKESFKLIAHIQLAVNRKLNQTSEEPKE